MIMKTIQSKEYKVSKQTQKNTETTTIITEDNKICQTICSCFHQPINLIVQIIVFIYVSSIRHLDSLNIFVGDTGISMLAEPFYVD